MTKEEALKYIKSWDFLSEKETKALETLIPELKESEDEKIRKTIFKALSKKDARDVLLANGIQVSDALAWLEKQGEQKPAWSEEDERIYNEIIDFFLGDIGTRCATIDKQRHFGYWLKSIKDRILPQSKQEWSEEDEKMIRFMIEYLERLNRPTGKSCIQWLKSLKPNHWKPSEEQMKHLKSISVGWHPDIKDCQVLNTLYNDLKKL